MSARSSTPSEPGPVAHVEGLEKRYPGRVQALRGVSLSVDPGTTVALIGPNGSGKTTLLRILAGELEWDRGQVTVLGHQMRGRRGPAPPSVGFATQAKALDPETTGLEALTLFHALREVPAPHLDGCLSRAVRTFGLEPFIGRRVHTYSGGQRRRLHLALETLHQPELLLLDEPTSDLDPGGQDSLWQQIGQWRAAGRTTLVVTHDLDRVSRHCDRVVVMGAGTVLADDAPRRLVDAHGRARSYITLAPDAEDAEEGDARAAAAAREALAGLTGALDVQVEDERVTVWRAVVPDVEPAVAVLTGAGLRIVAVEVRTPDLASAYHAVMAEHGIPALGGAGPTTGAGTP